MHKVVDYLALTVAVAYSHVEDRIQWISRCEGDAYVRAWITRRFLGIMMPRVAGWMMKRNELSATQSGFPDISSGMSAMSAYEHQLAQQQVEIVPDTIPLIKIVDEFLVDNFIMSIAHHGSINLILAAPADRVRISFQASIPQVHRIMGELMKKVIEADWAIPDPWEVKEGGINVMSAIIIN